MALAARYVLPLVLFFAAIVVESRLSGIFGMKLNLAVLFAYFAGLRLGTFKGLLAGAAIGLAEDSIAGCIVGPGVLGKGTVAFLASLLTAGFFKWTPLLGALVLIPLTALDGVVSYFLLSTFSGLDVPTSALVLVLALQSGANSLFGPFLKPSHER